MHPPDKKRNPAVPPSTNGADENQLAAENVARLGVTVKELALRHSVTSRTVWRWIKAARVTVVRTPGGHPRIVEVAR